MCAINGCCIGRPASSEVKIVSALLVPERAAGDKAPAADENAMNDALWEGLQMVRGGHNPRKALVVMTGATDYDSRPTSELMNAVR
jgi:hypothetical protein